MPTRKLTAPTVTDRSQFARLDLSERISALRDELPPGVIPQVQPYVPREF